MKTPSSLFSFFLLIFLPLSLLGQKKVNPIEVNDVKFRDIKVNQDRWIEAEIELAANPALNYDFEGQRSDKFLDNIKMTFSVAYETRRSEAGEYEFYQSEVEIVSLEKGEKRYVYFYLPGVIRERDALNDDPYAWGLEFEISGKELPLDPENFKDHFSRSIRRPELMNFFYKNLEKNIERNEGMLLPSYLAPVFVTSQSKNLFESANFARRQPKD